MIIDPLVPGDADDTARLLGDPDDAKGRFFTGLPTEATELREIFEAAREDRYWAVRVDGSLAGVFMLRGWDAGYATPAFGVVIAHAFRGIGLGRLALQFCESWCRLRGTTEIMLTVSPENRRAISLYESRGFAATGERSPKGSPIYRKRLG
jgi:GNAT superfamily N-acetyltransferase